MGILNLARGAARRGPRTAHLVEHLEGRALLSAVTLVSDLNTVVGAGSFPQDLVNLNGTLLFRTTGGPGTGLFRSDGTAAGTQRITTSISGKVVPAGQQAFFFSGTNLWVTDGSVAGTRLVKNIGATPFELVAMGGAVYFSDNSNATGNGAMRLWRSDGTAAGTVVIKTITERDVSPRDHQLTPVGSSLYFVASAGSPSNKYDIYKSDGTAEGTVLFKSVLSDFSQPSKFYAWGNKLYFNSGDYPTFTGTRTFVTDGVTTNVMTDAQGNPVGIGSVYGQVGNQLYFDGGGIWRTDGTPAGTVRIGLFYHSTYYQSQAAVGDTLFLAGHDGSGTGIELMKTDGTSVTLVKDINTTTISDGNSNPASLTAFDGRLYFSAGDGVYGNELWHSDGTADGTVLDTDIFPGRSSSEPENLLDIGGTLFFAAADAAHGKELFKLVSPLAAPLGLRAAQAGDTRITLTWGNPGTSATGFKIERSSDGVNFTEVATVTNPASGTYTDTGLTPLTTYYYRVRATTAGGDTPYSGVGVATTAAPLPAVPLSVGAAPVEESSTSVNVSWVDNSTNEDGFRVYRSSDPSPSRSYTLVATRPAGTQSYTDGGLAPGTTYYYLVASYNGFGEARSAAVSVATRLAQSPFGGAAALLPGIVQAENFDNGGPTIAYFNFTSGNAGGQYRTSEGVDIYSTSDIGGGYRVESSAGEWTEYTVDAGATGGTFRVELRAATAAPGGRLHLDVDGATAIGAFDLLSTGSASAFRTFQLGSVTLTPGTHLLRLVSDANPSGQVGVELNWMRFAGPGVVPSPAPSGLVAAALSRTAVSLAWGQQTTGETGFSIERRLAGNPTGWAVVGLADADATAYDDPTITPNTSYVFRVRAQNAAGASAYSNEAAVTTPDAPAVMVKDLNTRSPDSNPRSLVGANGLTYFVADDGASLDGQLWVSNGKAAGTFRLTTDMKPTRLTRVGNVVFFTNDRSAGSSLDAELWKTDGTVAGTLLVKDIFPGPVNSSIPDQLTNVNGTLYFTAVDATGVGRELWKSDGTAAGTVMVRDINPLSSSNPSNLVGVNGRVVFTADDGSTGTSLWVSDGTSAGTQLIADLWPGPDSLPIDLMTGAGGLAYFRSNTGELWRTDGTAAGSFKVSTTHPSQMIVVGNDAYFAVGTELWKSDGTVAGTALLNGGASTGPTGFATDGTSVYYFATVTGEQGYRLWRSDGTQGGTGAITGAGLAPWTYQAAPTGLMHAGGGHLFFSADDGTNGLELWTSDGTAGGTHQVADVGYVSEGSRPQGITSIGGGVVLFAASSPDPGRELWRSDGTAAGTTLVKDIRALPTEFSNPSTFTTVGNLTYFWANYSELWKTDGTEAGTQLIKYISPGGPLNAWPSPLVNVNGTVYFYAYGGAGVGGELFKTDGTADGTVLVADITPGPADSFFQSMAAVNGFLYFGGPGQSGAQYGLWRTDGTPEGTVLVQNLSPDYQDIYSIASAGSSIYFVTQYPKNTGGVDYVLWRTDGTFGTAAPLRTFDTPFGTPGHFTAIGNVLYFESADGGGATTLWRTDGTAGGTAPVFSRSTEFLTRIGSTLYFVGNGNELWKSDGTPTGTVKLHAFDPMQGGQFTVRDLTVVGNQLLFLGQESATGRELWRSDGTVAGTKIVADLVPGAGSSNPDMFRDSGDGKVYFRAFGNAAGLWQSDGTADGTQSITRPTLIDVGVSADKLAAAPNGDLFFTANDGIHGQELWKAYGAPPAPVGQATVGGVGGGSTDVSLTWTLGGGASLLLDSSPSQSASLTASQVTGYGIERRAGATGAWTQIAIAPGDATGYVDRSAAAGTTYSYRIRAVGSGGASYSTPIVATVAAPEPVLQSTTVNDGSAQRSQVTQLTLAFDRPVTLAAGAVRLELLNTGGSGADDGSAPTDASATLATPTTADNGKTWVFTFAAGSAFVQKTGGGNPTGSLADGIYTLSVDPAKVTAGGITMAAPASLTFHRLFGDVNGSKTVNTADFGLFRSAFGKATGQVGFDAAFDFDNSGMVNNADYAQFRTRYGKSFTY